MAEIQISQKSTFWRNVGIVIVLGLLIWQFAIPYIDDSIKTPSDYITDALFNSDTDDSAWHMILENRTTGYHQDFTGYLAYVIDMDEYNTYDLGIKTYDLSVNILKEYTWKIEINFWNTTINDWTLGNLLSIKIPGYEILMRDVWYIPTDYLFINYEITYSIHMSLLDWNGKLVSIYETPEFLNGVIPIDTQSIRLNDYAGIAP